jgi:hypothetical protein
MTTLLPAPPDLDAFLDAGYDAVLPLDDRERDEIGHVIEINRHDRLAGGLLVDVLVDGATTLCDRLGLTDVATDEAAVPAAHDPWLGRVLWIAQALSDDTLAARFVALCPPEVAVRAWSTLAAHPDGILASTDQRVAERGEEL